MSEIEDRYSRVARAFGDRLRGVAEGHWDSPTPCPDWAVRQLVAHVVNTHRRVLASSGVPAPEVEEDLIAGWREATAGMAAALADPERASGEVKTRAGRQRFDEMVGQLVCADTLVHTWDLARATGQDERLDPEAVERAFADLTPLNAAIRVPGGFGPAIISDEGAALQTRFLNFCGRSI